MTDTPRPDDDRPDADRPDADRPDADRPDGPASEPVAGPAPQPHHHDLAPVEPDLPAPDPALAPEDVNAPEEFPQPGDPPPDPHAAVDDPPRGFMGRFLSAVERLGNLLPDPVTLFALFALLVILISGLAGAMGLAVPDPRPEGAAGRAPDGMIRAVSLLNGDGLLRHGRTL